MSRFVKGTSGNPRGRPRKAKPVQASAFDIIFDRTITVVQNGAPRDLSIEEGLQLKTYQSALAGNKPARCAVLKMIAKREQWLASRRTTHTKVTMRREHAMRNADKALLILGIITPTSVSGPKMAMSAMSWKNGRSKPLSSACARAPWPAAISTVAACSRAMLPPSHGRT